MVYWGLINIKKKNFMVKMGKKSHLTVGKETLSYLMVLVSSYAIELAGQIQSHYRGS